MNAAQALIGLFVLAIGIFFLMTIMRNAKANTGGSGSGGNSSNPIQNIVQSLTNFTSRFTQPQSQPQPPAPFQSRFNPTQFESRFTQPPKQTPTPAPFTSRFQNVPKAHSSTADQCNGKSVFCCTTGLC